MAGWIRLNRDITMHWVYADAEKFKAWCTMIMLVNYQDNTQLIDGELIQCKRGQSLFSIATWVKKFGGKWTPQRVKTFFSLLEKDNMIAKEGLRKTTRLTVCKYESYQSEQPADKQEKTKRKLRGKQEITTTKEGKEKEEGKEGKEIKDIGLDFEIFWNLYDKKTGREKCEPKWNNLKLEDQNLILEFIPKYISSQPDKKFRKNPETFLNNKSWNDEIISESKNNNSKPQTRIGYDSDEF